MKRSSTSFYYKIALIVIATFFIVVSFYNFFYTISLPTDENIFAEPASKYYIIRNIQGIDQNEQVSVGDLIIKLDDKYIDSILQINQYIFNKTKQAPIKLTVFCFKELKTKNVTVNRDSLKHTFFIKLPSAAFVTSVAPGGASDRAGLRPGDIITKINGNNFSTVTEADYLLRNSSMPEVEYEILREGQTYKLTIELAKFGISFTHIIYFLTGLLFIAFGFFIGYYRIDYFIGRLLGFAFLMVGFAITGKLNPVFSLGYKINLIHVIILALANLSAIYGLAFLIHSLFYFPVELKQLAEKNRKIIYSLYILGSVFFLCVLIPLVFQKLYFLWVISSYGLGISYIVILIILLFKIKKSKLTKQMQSIGRPIYYSISINIAVVLIIPILAYFQLYYLTYINLLLLLLPISYVYTIGKYRLLNLDLRIRKNNQYIISVFLLRIALFALIFAFIWFVAHIDLNYPNLHFTGTSIEVLEKPLSEANRQFYNTTLSIILSISFIFLLLKFYNKTLELINRKFYRTIFDYKKLTLDLNNIIEKNITIDDFIQTISQKLKNYLHLNKVCIILLDKFQSNCNSEISSDTLNYVYENANEITNLIGGTDSILRIEYLPENWQQVFQKEGYSAIVPAKHKDKIYGFALIGEKLSEAPIDSEDFHIIMSFLNQAVVVIDNIKLYEDLASRERMRHELELARKIQLSSLPHKLPETDNIKVAAITIPAYEVGGDFYDFINVSEDGFTAIIGDVSGKGASAALYMSKVQGIIRTLSEFSLQPKELLIKANKLLYNYIEKNAFISVLVAKIHYSQSKLSVARAGHLPLIVFSSKEKRVLEIKPKGIILGASSNDFFSTNIAEETYSFSPGDILLMATDGAIEARNNDDEFGIERLKALVSHFRYLNPEDLLNYILSEIYRFSGKDYFEDDLSLIIIKLV